MAYGAMHRIKIHETPSGAVVVDSFERVVFNHDGSFSGHTTVKKEDFTGTTNDAFTVEVSYATGTEPTLATLTLGNLRTTAMNAVNAIWAGEVDPSAT